MPSNNDLTTLTLNFWSHLGECTQATVHCSSDLQTFDKKKIIYLTNNGCASCAKFLFLPHFDVICDLLPNRRTATGNLFVLYSKELKYTEKSLSPLYINFTTKTSRSKTIDHFTITCLVAWPLNESEASLSFKGQATKHTTVKWSIPHKNTRIQKVKKKKKKEKQIEDMIYPRGPHANNKNGYRSFTA